MGFWEKRRVTISGGNGFLGSFVVEKLRASGCASISTPHSREYDLREKAEALRLFSDTKPDIFIHLAAVVGGIGANRAAETKILLRRIIPRAAMHRLAAKPCAVERRR